MFPLLSLVGEENQISQELANNRELGSEKIKEMKEKQQAIKRKIQVAEPSPLINQYREVVDKEMVMR